mgnify:CR=1 FL=1
MAGDTEEYRKRLYVREKVEDMIAFAKPFLVQFPHTERVLATTIEEEMYSLLRLCVTAECGYKYKTTLQEIDVSQKTLQHYIRLAKIKQILSMKHYGSWSERLVEIGKMVGGLLEAVRQPAQHRG